MRRISSFLILVLTCSLLFACSASQIPKEVLQNNLLLQDENTGIELFYQVEKEDMIKGIYLKDKDKIAFYDWSNVKNETYYPTIHELDNENVAVLLVTGYGSGLLQSEIHIFKRDTFEEIECENPLEIIEENLVMEYQKNGLLIREGKKSIELPLPEEDAENLFSTPGIGAIVKYNVDEHELSADVSIQLTPACFAGTIKISYQFENGRYVFDTLQIEALTF